MAPSDHKELTHVPLNEWSETSIDNTFTMNKSLAFIICTYQIYMK